MKTDKIFAALKFTIVMSALILTGCGTTNKNIQLTNKERTEIKKLFIVRSISEVEAINPTLTVVQSARGTQVSVLGGGNMMMSRARYNEINAAAVKLVSQCISQKYEGEDYARTKIDRLISQIESNPRRSYEIVVASPAQQDRYFNSTDEQRLSLINEVGADASLVLTAKHFTGLHSHTFGIRTFNGTYSSLNSLLYDWEEGKLIYFSGFQHTDDVLNTSSEFCTEIINNYEAALNENVQIWTKAIIGAGE